MADSTEQIQGDAVPAADPTPVSVPPQEDKPIIPDSVAEKQIPTPTDDQVQPLQHLDSAQADERERASDSAISLNAPSESLQDNPIEQEEPANVDTTLDSQDQDHSQDPDHHPNSLAMETDESTLNPSDAVHDATDGTTDDPAAVSSTDPYTEHDEAYNDTELVSPVPAPSNETAESSADQNQPENEGVDNNNNTVAKGANSTATPGKPQHANNRNFQK
ncbi:hypothetical protein BGZ80_005293, partial [Entomortierella chlamydospora]